MKFIFSVLALVLVCNIKCIYGIVGGVISDITLHPYQVDIRHRNRSTTNTDFVHRCSGAIYDQHIIITVAHCVSGRVHSDFQVVAGSSYKLGTSGAFSSVKEIIFHEKYQALTEYYYMDIAILLLETPLPLNNYTIKAIDIAKQDYVVGTIATLSGWGQRDISGTSTIQLHKIDVPIVSREKCAKAYATVNTTLTDDIFCAGGLGKDGCYGDCGSPLVINDTLVGVISMGHQCGTLGFPGLYSSVYYFRSWIQQKINEAKARHNIY